MKTVKNVTVAKFELAFTRYRHNLKTTENSTVTSSVQSLQELDVKHTLRMDQSRSKSV